MYGMNAAKLYERDFTTGEIAEAVGVNRSVVSDWLARGIISAPQAPGRGRSRRFSFWNVVQAWIARDLNRMGIRAGEIKVIFGVAHVEFFQFEASLWSATLQDDCVLLIGFDSDGYVKWMRREPRTTPAYFENTVVVLRLDVRSAIHRVVDVLHKRSADANR